MVLQNVSPPSHERCGENGFTGQLKECKIYQISDQLYKMFSQFLNYKAFLEINDHIKVLSIQLVKKEEKKEKKIISSKMLTGDKYVWKRKISHNMLHLHKSFVLDLTEREHNQSLCLEPPSLPKRKKSN